MHSAVSSASFASFVAAFAAFSKAHSNSAMASAVDAAYDSQAVQIGDEPVKSQPLGEECSFASSGLHGIVADTGILSCVEDYICVEDRRSSLGGHCIPVDGQQRDLEDTTCSKCNGTNACEGLTPEFVQNNIGEGSCCGENACTYISGEWIPIFISYKLEILQQF